MKSFFRNFNLIILFSIFQLGLFAQTGPAGIGNSDGTDGHPLNFLWLNAGNLGLTAGSPVTLWSDISGNANHFGPSVSDPVNPVYQLNGSIPVVRFSQATGTGSKLIHSGFTDFPDNQISCIIVYNTNDANEGILSYATSSYDNDFLLNNSSNLNYHVRNNSTTSGADFRGQWRILTHKWRSSDGLWRLFSNGAQVYTTNFATGSVLTPGGTLAIGGEQDAIDGDYARGQALDGDIAEIILFNDYINDAERTIIENYLNLKYGITISNDIFANSAGYIYNLTGIGQENDGNFTSTVCGSTGLYLSSDGSLDNGDYVMVSHNNSLNSIVSDGYLPSGVLSRWQKDWYIQQTGSQNVKITFDFPEGISGQYPQEISNYCLLYRADALSNYAEVTASVAYGNADQVVFGILATNLQSGYYTIGTKNTDESPLDGEAGVTWYSLATGNWTDASKWTLDPSGALPNNPSNLYPNLVSDKVVIKSGKTMTMNQDSTHCASVTVDGRLDLGTTKGSQFDQIRGSGRIRLAADNFPAGDATHFISTGQGTIVYYGGGYGLTTDREFYNMEVEVTSGQTATLLANYTINGYLNVKSGTLQINNDASTTALNITINGNLSVSSGASITTGTANARHQLNMYGDFTNAGTVQFTNRTAIIYNIEADDGIVDANFLNPSANQSVICNGPTRFYRIEIDKGTDQTYILSLEASSTANFSLFGYANEGHGSVAQLTTNSNSLGLLRGTVKIENNIVIDYLSHNGNYNISVAARLWVAGGTVHNNIGSSTVPYGTLQISDGLFESNMPSGITLRETGSIVVEGGVVNTNQIRTSVLGSGHIGSYIQSGGTVNVRGSSITDTYYLFSMTYPGNVFSMSGGILHVYGARPLTTPIAPSGQSHGGAIFINSNPENINVTGGTVIMDISTNLATNNYKITSRAPFYNVIMRKTLGSSDDVFSLEGGTSGDNQAGDYCTLSAQPLVVLNNLTIEGTNSPIFVTNNTDVTIGGNFDLQSGAVYTHGTNTTTFNGSKNSFIHGRNVSTPAPLTFHNLTINKSAHSTPSLFYKVELADSTRTTDPVQANNVAIEIQGKLMVQRGDFCTYRHKARLLGNLEIVDGQITANATNPGRILLQGSVQQTLKGAVNIEQSFGSIELNNSSGASLLSNINVNNFYLNGGVMDLNVYNLDIQGTASTSGTYSNTLMFQTAGNSTDGGLSLYVNASGTYLFPLGTNANSSVRYTPASLAIANYSDDGHIQIRMGDEYLEMANSPGGNSLSYYWRVNHTGFTARPNIIFTFYASDSDDPVNSSDGHISIPSGIPGEILEESPYTRNGVAGGLSSVNMSFYTSTRQLNNAYYTAGSTTCFNGSLKVFYNRVANGNWNDRATWSNTSHTGNQCPGGGEGQSYPGPYDIVEIAGSNGTTSIDNVYININNARCAVLIFKEISSALSSLFINGNNSAITQVDLGRVSGVKGRIHVIVDGSRASQVTLNGDYTEFSKELTNEFVYINNSNNPVTLPSQISEFPMLRVTTENGSPQLNTFNFPMDIIVNSRMMVHSYLLVNNDITLTSGNFYIMNPEAWAAGRTGHLIFPGDRSSKVDIKGNLYIAREGRIYCNNNSTSSDLIQNLELSGNLTIESTAAIDLYNNTGTYGNSVNLTLSGENDASMTNTGTGSVELYRLIMNKLKGKRFTFSDPFSLQGTTTTDTKALELNSGDLILNDAAININLTTGGASFSLPSATNLEILQGTVNATGGSGILLDGGLLVHGGTVNMLGGNNFIQYSSTGNAVIDITSGALQVGSQIRRGTASTAGILKYSQSGGTLTVGTSAAGSGTRGIFEILNDSSSFTHSGGNFIIVNDYRSSRSIASFYFNPETADISSGTSITFGNSSSVAGRQNFTLYGGKPLMNLAINNANNVSPVVNLSIVPLTLNENLQIANGSKFDANGLQLNIAGNFTNNGTYAANGNKTVFNGTADQQISGTTAFYKLAKNTGNILSLANTTEITVTDSLSLSSGQFNTNENNVYAMANVFSSIVTNSSGASNGIHLSGTSQQEIRGNGIYDRLTINNPFGIYVPTGNTLTINEDFRLANGVFDIGKNLLILGENAQISEVSAFSTSNMVRTNISFTDAGLRKYFPSISSNTQFIYPIGSGIKYTPVQLDITSCNEGGYIGVKAADERHVSILNDVDNPEITDTANVLWYYWTLDANNISNFTAIATLDCNPSDIHLNNGHSAAEYITASLIDTALGTWTKNSTEDFNETTNELYFYFAGTNDYGIDGDYTAGIDEAIPDQVPSYITKQNGPWNDADTWETYPDPSGIVPGGGPRGAIVYIKDTVSMPNNFMASYITNIRNTGVLNVDTTFGHRLGIVRGTGKLYLERGDLPAGVYDGFFAPDSGTIEFGYTHLRNGNQNYDILSEITSVNNLILSGIGERRFANLDLTIYGDWILNADTVINEHNRTINVHGNITHGSGLFNAGFGNNAIVSLNGNQHQYIYGNFTGNNAFNHFRINNPEGLSLSASDIEIDNQLYLTSGVIHTTDQDSLTLNSIQENVVIGGGSGSFVSGPLFKNINNGGQFYFPVGHLGRYGQIIVRNENTTTGFWQAQYYNQNPENDGMNPISFISPLTMVSNNEYWRVKGPNASGDAAIIGLRWDAQSGMPTGTSNIDSLFIAEWRDYATDAWERIDPSNLRSGAGTTGTITSTVNSTFNKWTEGNYFTLSSTYDTQSITWTGALSTVWNLEENWNPTQIPTAIDDILIPNVTNDPVISSYNAVGSELTLNAGAILTIGSRGSLTLGGNLTMNGTINILSDANSTGSFIDNGITGTGTTNAMVQRYVSGNLEYHYLSSPLSVVPNSILHDVPGEYPNPNFYEYYEPVNSLNWGSGWDHTNAIRDSLDVGRGYAYAFSRNYTFNLTGGHFNTGPLTFPVTHTVNNGTSLDGWNLVGNPYPSALSAYDFLTANAGAIDGNLYFWDDDASLGTEYSTEDYATWNLAGSVGTAATGASKIPDGYISNGQAFFVHAPVTTTGMLNFTNSMRRIGNGQFFKNSAVDETKRLRISIASTDKTKYNQSLIVFIDGASDGFDNFYDGKKIKGNSNIAFYSLLNTNELAIQSLGPLDLRNHPVKVVPMGYQVSASGDYTFDAEDLENIGSEMDVYLEDKQTSIFVNLKTTSSYAFTTSAGTFNNRFVIHFNMKGEPTNEPPFLNRPLNDIAVYEDDAMSLPIGDRTFIDIDVNDKLTYSARLSGGQSLPAWLSVNPSTGELSGTPLNEHVGEYAITIAATDNSGESASDDLNLLVQNVNDPPVLNGSIPDQEVYQNTFYSYQFEQNLFTDVDLGDELTLSAKLASGNALPEWLSFSSANRQFSGTSANPENLDIVVTATDKSGVSNSDEFVLTVKSTTGIDDLNENAVIISPNPTKGLFYIGLKHVKENLKYQVIDYNGKTIKEGLIDSNLKQVDIKGFANGVYFVEISDGNESMIYKIVLQK